MTEATPAAASGVAALEPGDQPLPSRGPRLPGHIPALDGIRGLAVILVLFCHGTQRPYGFGAGSNAVYTGAFDRLILNLSRISFTGVDLFFVLSGFLITGILFDAKGKDHFFRNFYARRTVRIFPLYYASLIVFLLIWPRFPAWMSQGFGELQSSQAWYWLYHSNYSQGWYEQLGRPTEHILHVSWSLSIEEQFYLCWPMVVFLSSRKMLLKITVGMFFGSLLLRIGLTPAGKGAWASMFTPCRLDGLAVGAAIALIARGPRGILPLVRPAWMIGPASALALMALFASRFRDPGFSIGYPTLFALLYGSLLTLTVAAVEGSVLNRFFSHPSMRMFGKYSYAIYLLHLPVMILIAEWVFKPHQMRLGPTLLPGLVAFHAVTWTLTVIVSLLSWNLMEKHFLKLKDYFPLEGGRPQRPALE